MNRNAYWSTINVLGVISLSILYTITCNKFAKNNQQMECHQIYVP